MGALTLKKGTEKKGAFTADHSRKQARGDPHSKERRKRGGPQIKRQEGREWQKVKDTPKTGGARKGAILMARLVR